MLSIDLDMVAAVSTAAAAIFAAVSAWTSARSAAAASAAVDEARAARRAELAPRIVMEKCFLDLHFVWPHPDGLNGGPVFLARKHWKDNGLSPPLFTLQNFGQSPAIDVRVVFELEDSDGDLAVPIEWSAFGLSLEQVFSGERQGAIPSLKYSNQGGTGYSLPLYRRWSLRLPHISPGSPRELEFPRHIANRLLLRGIQRGSSVASDRGQELALWAKITCFSMDREKHEAEFRWSVLPFTYGPQSPINVHCHCHERPLLDGEDDPPIV